MAVCSKMALITQIIPLSSHDGPGSRTTLFLKGCSLRCVWCHNPETIRQRVDIFFQSRLCIGCGECRRAAAELGFEISSPRCLTTIEDLEPLNLCAERCPSKALKLTATEYSAAQIAQQIRQSVPLLKSLGGGVTFSGGEPMLQSQFIEQVIDMLADEQLHFVVDSCGAAPWESYEQLLPKIDMLLFDIKQFDDSLHREYTGAGNRHILDNLMRTVELIEQQNLRCKIWIRTPLIPSKSATRENISAIAKFISTLPSKIVNRWELCTFNNLCNEKYQRLGLDWELRNEELLDQQQMEELFTLARSGTKSSIDVKVSGLTRRDKGAD